MADKPDGPMEVINGVPTYKFTVRGSKKDLDGTESPSDSTTYHTDYARKQLTKAELRRSTAAEKDDEAAYKDAQESIKWWRDHLMDLEKTNSTTKTEPNILKQAGTLFNNLK